MKSFLIERKQKILTRLLLLKNERVADISKEEGIEMQTWYNWKNKPQK